MASENFFYLDVIEMLPQDINAFDHVFFRQFVTV